MSSFVKINIAWNDAIADRLVRWGVVKMVLLKYKKIKIKKRKYFTNTHTHTHTVPCFLSNFLCVFLIFRFYFFIQLFFHFLVYCVFGKCYLGFMGWIDERMRMYIYIVCVCVFMCVWGKISSSMRHLTHIYNIYTDSTTGKISTNFVKYSQRNNIWNIILWEYIHIM